MGCFSAGAGRKTRSCRTSHGATDRRADAYLVSIPRRPLPGPLSACGADLR
jgi:hypothetical protein